ncbi:folate-binding protein YgfZ [Ignatzschineria larvae DSM 13226]|uniref:Folate-binding protein YgfZ n=1 Tax=Ignatzschineria larvae DSM 13226 TaxID=1111732 RepID=A0ABZ3BY86_9GAMM|nr:folate-binding protein YgfZ [Ignatzschineria larvae]
MSISLSRLRVEGQDAATFLQGQITADIHHLNFLLPCQNHERTTGLAALCNRQGRVITLFWIIKTDSGFNLLLPSALAEKVAQYLKIFIFRAKVTLTIEDVTEADLITLPSELIIPWITESNSEAYVPQMLSLDILGAISFKKGCYTGQEIVARMQYLGKHKRRLALIEVSSQDALTINGKLIAASGIDAGDIVYFDRDKALVVLRLSEQNKPLTLADHPEISVSLRHIWHEANETDTLDHQEDDHEENDEN